MKNLIICILMLASFAAKAQVFRDDNREYMLKEEQESKKERRKLVDNHITSLKAYKQKAGASSSPVLDYEVAYDEKGNMTAFKNYKHGKLKEIYTYKYSDAGKNTELAWLTPNGRLRYLEQYTFNAAGSCTDSKIFYHRPDRMTWHDVFTYDEKQNMTESRILKSGDKKLYSRYTYFYNEDGTKKQTIQYNGKGKVEHIWNYDCSPVGKLADADFKDSSKICIRYETDKDGNRIKIIEEFIEDGRIARTVTKRDLKDNMLDYSTYNHKGIRLDHNTGIYDAQDQLTELTVYKKKSDEVKERYVYHYDTAGIITELITYKNKPSPAAVLKYDYARGQ